MKSPTGSPLQRIAIAVALSILVHSLLLWQWPKIEFPDKTELPPLQAKLELLPKLAPVAQQPGARKPKIKTPARPQAIVEPDTTSTPVITETAASSVPAEPTAASATDVTDTLAQTPAADEELPPLLPRHAQLHFAVQYGSAAFQVGEVIHVLENSEGRYTLRAVTQTTGLANIFKSYHLTQTSSGSVTKQGLRPDSYIEVKSNRSGTQTSSASFDWDEKKIHFANGKESALTDQAQDVLSLPYHLSRLALNAESIPIAMSNGKNIRQYYLAVGDEGTISTPMGELRTIALHKVRDANEEGLIIWLALEYRLLPVKILYLDKSGEITAHMVITDIRVSDE